MLPQKFRGDANVRLRILRIVLTFLTDRNSAQHQSGQDDCRRTIASVSRAVATRSDNGRHIRATRPDVERSCQQHQSPLRSHAEWRACFCLELAAVRHNGCSWRKASPRRRDALSGAGTLDERDGAFAGRPAGAPVRSPQAHSCKQLCHGRLGVHGRIAGEAHVLDVSELQSCSSLTLDSVRSRSGKRHQNGVERSGRSRIDRYRLLLEPNATRGKLPYERRCVAELQVRWPRATLSLRLNGLCPEAGDEPA
jgi:hypothetical protein